jgi:hypothetical protein
MKTSDFHRGILLGVALVAGMPLSAAAKCSLRGPDGRTLVGAPLVVIDGRQGRQSDIDRLRLNPAAMFESIYALHILCWNPADSTYNQGGRGIAVTQVLTKPFVERLLADLEKVAAAQQSFFATRGTYSARLEELGVRDGLAQGVSIELSVSPTGWSAVATKGLMVHRCMRTVTRDGPACSLSIDSSLKHALTAEG